MAKVEAERFFGNKGIIIMIRDGNKFSSAIFKDKKNADKFNRNNPADVKKLLQLAKKTKFPKAIDEDTDVGHEDDEPNMLKSTALEIMEYGKKLMDKLDKYDDMEGEVDFPNWWQSKLTLAKDYVQKAYHYLDSEEKTSETIDRSFRYDGYEDDEGPVDEAFLVAYGKREGNKTIKPAFAAYADKKMAQKFMADMKKDGYKVMMTQKKIRGIDEGQKRYNQKNNVCKSKYVISYHDGKKKHKDGSDFFDIQTFRNKKDLAKFVNALHRGGYKYGFGESVNERLYVPSKFDKALDRLKFNQFTPKNIKKLADKFKVDYKDAVEFIKQNKVINVANKPTMAEASKEAMGIAGFTGTRGIAVDDFIKKNKIDARKLFNFVRKGNLRDRMDFVTAIAGKPNNKFFKMIVGRFAESVNEDKNQIVKLKKKVGKSEIKFYDALSKIEKKLGKKKYRAFLEKGLKDFKINAKHYDYRSNGAAEEKLFQLAK